MKDHYAIRSRIDMLQERMEAEEGDHDAEVNILQEILALKPSATRLIIEAEKISKNAKDPDRDTKLAAINWVLDREPKGDDGDPKPKLLRH